MCIRDSFYTVKEIGTWLAAAFGVDCKAEEGGEVYYHPGRRAVLAHDNERFAALGEIHPDVAARFDIDGRVYVLEVDLTALMAMALSLIHI